MTPMRGFCIASLLSYFVHASRLAFAARVSSEAEELDALTLDSDVANHGFMSVYSDPFDIAVTILNKDEVVYKMGGTWFGWAMGYVVSDHTFMDNIATKFETLLPEKLAEKGFTVDLTRKSIEGLTATLTMQVKAFDMKSVLTMAKGERFATALTSLQGIFKALGKDDKYPAIEAKIGTQIRAAMMRKIPATISEQLAGQNVSAQVATDPPPPEQEAQTLPPREPDAPRRVIFSVVFKDREAIVAQAAEKTGGGVKGALASAAVRHMSCADFQRTVGEKLQEKIPATIAEKLAEKGMDGALDVSLEVEDMMSAGSTSSVDAFWMVLNTRVSFDAIKAKNKALGDLVAALTVLKEEGLEAMGVMLQNIAAQTETKVIQGIAGGLPGNMGVMLNANVAQVAEDAFAIMQHRGASGRCCGPYRGTDGPMFWVSQDYLKYGSSCPWVHEEQSCRVDRHFGPIRQPPAGVKQTHHRATVECGEEAKEVTSDCVGI